MTANRKLSVCRAGSSYRRKDRGRWLRVRVRGTLDGEQDGEHGGGHDGEHDGGHDGEQAKGHACRGEDVR